MFCRIERASKRRFVVALTGDIAEKRDKAILVPLIKKYILPKSIIFSDCWGAYTGLSDLEGFNYRHFTINHSTNFVHEENKNIHTQNIERLWRDVKEWCKRPSIRAKWLEKYLARYLFKTSADSVWHQFWTIAAALYPPGSDRKLPRRPKVAPTVKTNKSKSL